MILNFCQAAFLRLINEYRYGQWHFCFLYRSNGIWIYFSFQLYLLSSQHLWEVSTSIQIPSPEHKLLTWKPHIFWKKMFCPLFSSDRGTVYIVSAESKKIGTLFKEQINANRWMSLSQEGYHLTASMVKNLSGIVDGPFFCIENFQISAWCRICRISFINQSLVWRKFIAGKIFSVCLWKYGTYHNRPVAKVLDIWPV